MKQLTIEEDDRNMELSNAQFRIEEIMKQFPDVIGISFSDNGKVIALKSYKDNGSVSFDSLTELVQHLETL